VNNDESPKPEFSVVHNPAPEPKSVPVPKKQNKGAAISPPGQVEEHGQITTNSRIRGTNKTDYRKENMQAPPEMNKPLSK